MNGRDPSPLAARAWLAVVAAGFCALAGGCGSVTFAGDATRMGEFRVQDLDLDQILHEVPAPAAERVRVFVGQFPDGISWKDQSVVIAERSRYDLLGRVAATPHDPAAALAWFYPYAEDESWRRVYCWAQVPLIWLTVSVWWDLPFYWPCFVASTNKPYDVAGRKRRIIEALQKGTVALGGNLLVVTQLGPQSLIGPPANRTGGTMGATDLANGGEGFAFRDKLAGGTAGQ